MNEQDYLTEVVAKTYSPDCKDHAIYNMVGLGGEAGEIVNMAQKAMRGDFNNSDLLTPDHPQRGKLIEELGGLIYFFTALCWRLGVSPDLVRSINAEKLMSRLERGTIRGDGDDR